MSRDRETYLKFKPMADDLRQAESWCKSDGVLNRNKTMQNLYEMGYRKQSDVIAEFAERLKNYPITNLDKSLQISDIIDDVAAKMKGGGEE